MDTNQKNSWAFIVNPYSGKNRAKQLYKSLEKELQQRNINFEIHLTEYAGHLQVLFNDLLNDGFRKFIISGGDGTFGETANALYHQKSVNPAEICFAFAPAGTGNDWARTMRISSNSKKIVDLIEAGFTIQQDLAQIDCFDENNQAKQHFFINVAGMGFDTFIAENYLSGNKQMGVLTYYVQTVKGILKYDNHFFTIEYEEPQQGWKKIEGKMFEVAFGLCQYFGGGMKITPLSDPTSGLIDLTVIKDVNNIETFTQLPRLLTGKFIDYHKVETALAKRLKLSASQKEYIQADGELIGYLPAEIQIIPKAMNIIVEKNLSF